MTTKTIPIYRRWPQTPLHMMRLAFAYFFCIPLFSLLPDAMAAEQGIRSFKPGRGISAQIAASSTKLLVFVATSGGSSRSEFLVETGKNITINVEDYNFDGYKDFSASFLDDGMGIYTVYLVFIYLPLERKFISFSPTCGDEFINLTTLKHRRTLQYSYFNNNRMKTCKIKF